MLPLMSFKILIGKRPKSLIFSSEGPACEAPAGLPQFVLPIYSLKPWDLRAFACAVSFSWNAFLIPSLFYSNSPLSGHTVVQAWARYKIRVPIFPSITLSRSSLSRQDTRSWFPLHVSRNPQAALQLTPGCHTHPGGLCLGPLGPQLYLLVGVREAAIEQTKECLFLWADIPGDKL